MYHGQECGVCRNVMILVPVGTVIYPVCKWCQEQNRHAELVKKKS